MTRPRNLLLLIFAVMTFSPSVATADAGGGMPAIHFSSWKGDVLDVIFLLHEGLADVNSPDNYGNAPLDYASENGQVEMTKFLLFEGAYVNAINDDGQTPLHFASGYGHVEVVKVLLASGANVNAKNNDGDTPLHLASKNGHMELVNLLIAADAVKILRDPGGVMTFSMLPSWNYIFTEKFLEKILER